MRIAILTGLGLLAALSAVLSATGPALAQLPPALAIGQFEIKAYQAIPKAKTAVQLTSADSALGRNLRGKVMDRLAKRGNEVGFSGGNVMRLDVTYIDLSGGGGGGSSNGGQSYDAPGNNPRPEMLGTLGRLRGDSSSAPASRPPTLRLSLTLYSIDTGKVLWVASASCSTPGNLAPRTGEAMINSIFDNADKSLIGDAGCPL